MLFYSIIFKKPDELRIKNQSKQLNVYTNQGKSKLNTLTFNFQCLVINKQIDAIYKIKQISKGQIKSIAKTVRIRGLNKFNNQKTYSKFDWAYRHVLNVLSKSDFKPARTSKQVEHSEFHWILFRLG